MPNQITVNTDNSQINIDEGGTRVITIVGAGPQGPAGPVGPQGPSGSDGDSDWYVGDGFITSSLSIVLSGSNPNGQIFVESLYQTPIDDPDTDGYPIVYYETSSGKLVRQFPSDAQRIISAERVTATYPSSIGATRRITNKNIEIVNGYFAITGSGGIKTISDVEITGSLNVTGSVNLNSSISGSFSGSFEGNFVRGTIVNTNLVSSPVVSFTNNIDEDITILSGSHAVSIGDITINSSSTVNVGGTWDILDSYFFTQAFNKQIYGLLFDFDGVINLSFLVGQNLWKNNSTAERWYNNAYQWDPNEVDSSQRGRVKIKVGLTYDKDGGNAYVRLTDVRDGVKTYLGEDWHQLTTSNPSSPIFTEFEFEGIDGAGTPFTPGGIDRYLALESFTDSGIFLGLYKADVKLTVY